MVDAMLSPAAGPTRVRLVLARAGQVATVKKPGSTSTSDDPLNNDPSGSETWTPVSDEVCYRFYESANDQEDGSTGEYDEDRPKLAFSPDNSVEQGYRVVYDGTVYEVDTRTPHDGYVVWTARETDQT